MGLAGLSFWHLLTLVVVIVLVFGTKKLGTIGSDLGAAIKGFRQAMANDEAPPSAAAQRPATDAPPADKSAPRPGADSHV